MLGFKGRFRSRSGLLNIIGLAVLLHQSSVLLACAGVAVRIGQNIAGYTNHNNVDPDPAAAAGSNYVVELVRGAFTVYNKSDGSVAQTMSISDFWQSVGVTVYPSVCCLNARIVYDPLSDRWFAAHVLWNCDLSIATGRLCLAVSQSGDPTGAWQGVTFTDNPGSTNYFAWTLFVGLDDLAVYISSTVWPTNSANVPVGTALWSLPKADLLANPPTITNATWFANLDPKNYGYTVAPAICFDGSARGAVLATGSTGVNAITGNPETNTTLFADEILNAAGSSAATLGVPKTLGVLPYTEPINYALQPDGSSNLVDWDAEFSSSIYCVGGVLFAAHALQYGPHIALRWYRINAADNTLLESGTISDPNLDLYFPSITANTNGTVVVACNGSGLNQFVSCYALVGQTVNGVTTFGDLLLLQAGAASFQYPDSGGHDEWGSFSTISIDPTDPNIFWSDNTYASDPTTWSTQITQILTSPSPQLSIANSGSNLVLSWPVTAVPFQLESTQDLGAGAGWSLVTPAGTTNGATLSATVPVLGPPTFFRLIAAP